MDFAILQMNVGPRVVGETSRLHLLRENGGHFRVNE